MHLSISPVFVVNWSQFGYHCKPLGLVMVVPTFQNLYVESNCVLKATYTASNHSKAMHMRTKFAGCNMKVAFKKVHMSGACH